MGVIGLWSLLEPVGKPLPLESLQNKVLAIDVSIWLNQSVKGVRDASGNAVPHAHVLSLFHRVCKLLFYQIKPIFVFDGKPPQIKRDTLDKRRKRKGRAKKLADASRLKLLENYLKSRTVEKQIQRQSQVVKQALENGPDSLAKILNNRRNASQPKEKDLFELPQLVKEEDDYNSDSSSDREDVMGRLNIHQHTDLHQINLEDDNFKSLPTHQQAEVLIELREKRKQNSWAKIHEMPSDAQNFSGFQLERLQKRAKMHKTLDEVGQKAMEDSSLLHLDTKLFVGDREGMKKEKRLKKEIVGKDFVYGKLVSNRENLPGTSKSQPDFEEIEEESELDQLLLQEDEMSQSEILATIQKDKESEEDEILILEPSNCKSSKRQGGMIEQLKLESQFDQVQMSESSSSSEDESDDKKKDQSSEDSSSDNDFVEVEVRKDEDPGQDDLFADIFKTQESHKALEEILKNGPKKTIPDIPERALEQVEDKSEGFPKEEKKKKDFAKAMKEQNHLFLKIASKWAEEEEEEKDEANGSKSNNVQPAVKADNLRNRPSLRSGEESILVLDDTEKLISEMREKVNKERLLRAKTSHHSNSISISPNKLGAKSSGEGLKNRVDLEEVKILSELDVSSSDKAAYDNSVIKSEKLEDESANQVYGASAPGFVRGKQSENVIEVESGEMLFEDSISVKLEALEETDETSLSTDELLRIQRQLAADQNILIAERSRQERLAATITDQMYADCQDLLQMFGLPWIVSPAEAEAECAFLDMIGLSDGTVTDDSDIWLFGGQKVYKNFFNQEKHCEQFQAGEIVKAIGLSREKMIALALLTGSDYTEGIESVGPVTAMEILAEFSGSKANINSELATSATDALKRFKKWTIDNKGIPENKVKENLRKLSLPEDFPSDVVVKAYLFPEVDNSTEAFSWAVPNFVEIRDYVQEQFGWDKRKVDEILKPVIKRFAEKNANQKRIEDFFHRDNINLQNNPNTLQAKSKRVQSAIHKVLGRKVPEISEAPKNGLGKKNKDNGKKPEVPTNKTNIPQTSASTSKAVSSDNVVQNSKEIELKRKAEMKRKAIEIYNQSKKKKKADQVKVPKRVVLNNHNLSESDSE